MITASPDDESLDSLFRRRERMILEPTSILVIVGKNIRRRYAVDVLLRVDICVRRLRSKAVLFQVFLICVWMKI